jgi:hypothetical protein
MGFPRTLQEFQTAFPDEASCWEMLRRIRWPRGFVCPRCRCRESSWISTQRLPLRGVLIPVREDQPDRPLTNLLRKLG